MKLYTRSGDDGTTGLFGGQRVAKDHPRIDAYGTVDELNAMLGLAAAALSGGHQIDHGGGRAGEAAAGPSDKSATAAQPTVETDVPAAPSIGGVETALASRLHAMLALLQARLFNIGADLATPEHSRHESRIRRLSAGDVTEIERWIDEIDGGNDPIRVFILPGGTELAARLHVARTVCRRAERAMIALGHVEHITPESIVYMNRLSDLLFAMARRANKAAGVADIPWRQE